MPHWVGIGKLEKGVRPPHSCGGGCAGGSEAAAAAASMSEVAHDPKKHGVTVLYSGLSSGQPLVQRRLCSNKCVDSIHNNSKLPRTDMNMLQRQLCCVGRAGSVSRG